MISEDTMGLSSAREAAHFLISSLSAVRGLSKEAARAIEFAIYQCDDRLMIPERALPAPVINRNALLHALNYAIPELEQGRPEAAAAVSLAVSILVEQPERQNQ
ncbi:hypothetical protein E3C22_18820 [Jiella endophytica]|uniref:Uncharacterized protein n=1 Tax=Jiella endophytica TaxID=2558362 RepID=A0A4Y8RDD8_9HYPH|nr:hypothetical protein [Jiella endophytica]TFF19742.1 hypothetical protein E3C22_18820 [Jiella endophytica]